MRVEPLHVVANVASALVKVGKKGYEGVSARVSRYSDRGIHTNLEGSSLSSTRFDTSRIAASPRLIKSGRLTPPAASS